MSCVLLFSYFDLPGNLTWNIWHMHKCSWRFHGKKASAFDFQSWSPWWFWQWCSCGEEGMVFPSDGFHCGSLRTNSKLHQVLVVRLFPSDPHIATSWEMIWSAAHTAWPAFQAYVNRQSNCQNCRHGFDLNMHHRPKPSAAGLPLLVGFFYLTIF